MGALAALVRTLGVLDEDVTALVKSVTYKRTLTQCLLNPYVKEVLADFLVLDNICRDLRFLVGAENTAAFWEARAQVFDEARCAVEATAFPDGKWEALGRDYKASATRGDRERLWGVLLNALSKRTPDDVYEQIEVGLK